MENVIFRNLPGASRNPYLTISNSAAETVAGGARKDTGEALPAALLLNKKSDGKPSLSHIIRPNTLS